MFVEFWGAAIPSKKKLHVEVNERNEYVHVTQVALPVDAVSGRNSLILRRGDEEYVLCTLDLDKCAQASLDLVVDVTFTLSNSGTNQLHVTGLRQSGGSNIESIPVEGLALSTLQMFGEPKQVEESLSFQSNIFEDEDCSRAKENVTKNETHQSHISRPVAQPKTDRRFESSTDRGTHLNASTCSTPPNMKEIYEDYAQKVTEYLKRHPRTHIAALGGKVKKPRNMMWKLKAFLKTRSDRYEIDGNFASNV